MAVLTAADKNLAMKLFLKDIVKVYREHGLCLGRQDDQGAFEVHAYNENLEEWLMNADDKTYLTLG